MKAHSRKLGSETVEQLAQKMKDMPTITHRAIVSASGFTRPAIRKAKKHGVELYELKQWEASKDVDFFRHALVPSVNFQYSWHPLNCVCINPSNNTPGKYDLPLFVNPLVAFEMHKDTAPIRLREWLIDVRNNVVSQTENQFGTSLKEGTDFLSASMMVNFTTHAWIVMGGEKILIQNVKFEGIVKRHVYQMPSMMKALVRLGDRWPLAGCCISELGDRSLVASIITAHKTLQIAYLSVTERNKQKIFRQRLPKTQMANAENVQAPKFSFV